MSIEASVEKSIKKSVETSVEKSFNTYRQVIESMGGVASFSKGVSMRPLIRQGKGYVSVIAVDEPQVGDDLTSRTRSKWGYRESHGSAELAVNDIILFEQMRRGEKMNILHRLIAIRESDRSDQSDQSDTIYICRGDNNTFCEYIRREDIIEKVDRIFWTKEAGSFPSLCSLMPRLLGADRDRQNGGWVISVESPGYLCYVRLWDFLWPLRRIYFKCRGSIRSRLSKIGWLKKLYHKFKGQ